MSFVVKLKTKDTQTPHYANFHIIYSVSEISELSMPRSHFILSLPEANKLVKMLVIEREMGLDYISIVRLSHYKPYPEQEVVYYQEFK